MRVLGNLFLFTIGMIIIFITYSYFTYGNGSKSDAQIALEETQRLKQVKECDTMRLMATSMNVKDFSYWDCLQGDYR